MCLLKPGDHNNNVPNCNHDECRNFKFLNKPTCVYTMTQNSKPDQNSIINNISTQTQGVSKKPSLLDSLALQKLSAFKEVSNSKVSESPMMEEESFALNKKKMKLEGNSFSKPPENSTVMLPTNMGYTQIIANPSMTDRAMLHQNNMMDPGQQNIQMCFVPINQHPQQIDLNMQNLSYVQTGVQPIQGFPQNFKMNSFAMDQNSGMMIPMTVSESTPKHERNPSALEELMRDTQKTLVDMLISQNKMLVNLKEKNDLVQDTLACLITEVNALKQTIKQNSQEKSIQSLLPKQFIENSREIATTETLLHVLYGTNQDFPYQLMFKNEFQLPLYRERNFKFTVLLTDKNGNQIKNPNKIPLTLAIYTSENIPKFVDVNTSGNKILKGLIDKDLVNGAVTFDKIQIKEVTSHFRNGWIFFVVYPKIVTNGYVSTTNAVSAKMIKPIIVEKVVVKAKRAKLTSSITAPYELKTNNDVVMEVEDAEDESDAEDDEKSVDESQEIFTEAASDSGLKINN